MNAEVRDRIYSLCEAERFDEAEALLQAAFGNEEIPEERVKLLLLLSDVYDRAGAFDEACKALFMAIEIDKEYVKAWNNLGVLCLRADKADAAREAFLHAAVLDPDNPDVLTNLGSASLKLSDPMNAMLHLEHALAVAPHHAAAHANLALTYATFGRIEDAEEQLRLAVFHGFTNADAILDKLERMKVIRERIQKKEMDNDTSDTEPK